MKEQTVIGSPYAIGPSSTRQSVASHETRPWHDVNHELLRFERQSHPVKDFKATKQTNGNLLRRILNTSRNINSAEEQKREGE